MANYGKYTAFKKTGFFCYELTKQDLILYNLKKVLVCQTGYIWTKESKQCLQAKLI